jgi:hypothetical protein
MVNIIMASYTLQELTDLAKEREYYNTYQKTLDYFELRKKYEVIAQDDKGKKVMNPFANNGVINAQRLELLQKESEEANSVSDYLDACSKSTLEYHIKQLTELYNRVVL